MNKVAWMLERIMKDIKTYFPKILKVIGVILLFFGFGRMLSYYGRMEFYLPITMTILFIYGIYSWYSMEWDWEQKKIVDKLKGKR
tara:strand:+ start:1273 stop:1527 length:255 start_codon:yes stop_codon:yes gene_type:complete